MHPDPHLGSTAVDALAIAGGAPVRRAPWPLWPRADEGTESIVREVLHSGRWAISGAYRGQRSYERRFAEAFAAWNGVARCVPTTSGTSSLTIALLGLGIGPGDEVLVPGMTWVACASSVACIGATPILVDVEPDTLAMSLDAARAAIGPRTRAIMLVHTFCRLADIDGFVALAARHGIPLIEDCSQAHGARWRGQRVGSFGTVGCFSMQQAKVLTSGEGGAAITNDERLYARMEQLRCDGRVFAPQPREGRLELVEVGEVQGQNLCLSEIQAAILLDRLTHVDAENAVRRERVALLEALLAEKVPGVRTLPAQEGAEQTYCNLVLRVDTDAFAGCTIDVIARALGDELRANILPIYDPLDRHRLYSPLRSPRIPHDEAHRRALDPTRFHLPNALAARARCFLIPHYLLLDGPEGMHDIANALAKIQANAGALRDLGAPAPSERS
jgi:L-glutamine:scyllo-inosose aminotransferase/L-glutamine:2-deoxy-scyllo-inosose/3-amino-2,3-dideoxy-scyllo-inosose aminotransferase